MTSAHPGFTFLTPRFLFIWLGLFTLYRLLVLLQPHMGLFFDEAYYAHWAQAPAFGYYSKPPMVAWLIAVSTSLLGASDLSVKLFSPILYGLTACLVFLLGRRLVDEKTGVIAALIFSAAPMIGFNSLFITTDAPLFFFWALSALVFLDCLEKNTWLSWGALGLCFGLGMLSKYTFAALPIGLISFLLLTRRFHLFWSAKAWLATLLALAIFSSNLYWNWQHEFISFTHTKEIAQLDGPLMKPGALALFLLSQCLIFGAVWSVLLAVRFKHLGKGIAYKDGLLFLLCLLLPILVIIGTQALLSRAFANWAAPFIVAASIMTAVVLKSMRSRWLLLGLVFNLSFLSVFYHWPVVLSLANIEESKKNSPYYRLSGWRQLAYEAKPVIDTLEGAKLLSNSRELLAYIGFYADVPARDIVYWRQDRSRVDNHYDLVANIEDLALPENTQFIYLSRSPLKQNIQSRFATAKLLGQVDYDVSKQLKRELYLYQLSGFKGYAKAQ